VASWQWNQLDHKQNIYILFRTDNHASTSSLNIFVPNKQFQSNEGTANTINIQQEFRLFTTINQ